MRQTDDINIAVFLFPLISVGSTGRHLESPSRAGIILERSHVVDNLANLPLAMCVLFGFTYALHLEYPKCMKNTFSFIQQVMLNLGQSRLTPKLQTLKNALALEDWAAQDAGLTQTKFKLEFKLNVYYIIFVVPCIVQNMFYFCMKKRLHDWVTSIWCWIVQWTSKKKNLQAQVTEGPWPECTELAIPCLAIPC